MSAPKPVLAADFYHDGRGPTMERVIWHPHNPKPAGFEYTNPDSAGGLRHLKLIQVEAFAYAGEEVHGGTPMNSATNAAIHDLGRSEWLLSLCPLHLKDCSHFCIEFYDEIFDVVCHGIETHAGPFAER